MEGKKMRGMLHTIGHYRKFCVLITMFSVLLIAAIARLGNAVSAIYFEREITLASLVSDYRRIDELAEEYRDAKLNIKKEIAIYRTRRNEILRTPKRPFIVVSLSENRLLFKNGDGILREATCSTGKGTTLQTANGEWTFRTPRGKLRVIGKDKEPLWRPPDWHYYEEARSKGKQVIKLAENPVIRLGESNGYNEDLFNTHQPEVDLPDNDVKLVKADFKANGNSTKLIKLEGNRVVKIEDGNTTELPEGELIETDDYIVIPPLNSPQREFKKVMGEYRLRLGSGYGIHGTNAKRYLGKSVTHGCVRLGDEDMKVVFENSEIGTEVFIY